MEEVIIGVKSVNLDDKTFAIAAVAMDKHLNVLDVMMEGCFFPEIHDFQFDSQVANEISYKGPFDHENAEEAMAVQFYIFMNMWKTKSNQIDLVFHQAWVDVPVINTLMKKHLNVGPPFLSEDCGLVSVFDVNSEEFGWITDEKMITGLILPHREGVVNSAMFAAQKHIVMKHNVCECDQRLLKVVVEK
jgi:hypothetical protein